MWAAAVLQSEAVGTEYSPLAILIHWGFECRNAGKVQPPCRKSSQEDQDDRLNLSLFGLALQSWQAQAHFLKAADA